MARSAMLAVALSFAVALASCGRTPVRVRAGVVPRVEAAVASSRAQQIDSQQPADPAQAWVQLLESAGFTVGLGDKDASGNSDEEEPVMDDWMGDEDDEPLGWAALDDQASRLAVQADALPASMTETDTTAEDASGDDEADWEESDDDDRTAADDGTAADDAPEAPTVAAEMAELQERVASFEDDLAHQQQQLDELERRQRLEHEALTLGVFLHLRRRLFIDAALARAIASKTEAR